MINIKYTNLKKSKNGIYQKNRILKSQKTMLKLVGKV